MASAVMDVPRMQYGKLLALERKEMQNQKDISDCWVRFIYLLLETTMRRCAQENILFSNLDEFQQVSFPLILTGLFMTCVLLSSDSVAAEGGQRAAQDGQSATV